MPEGSSSGSNPGDEPKDEPKPESSKPIRASFSLASALSMIRKKQDQQMAANQEKERALEEEIKEKARIKRRRRRQNQKIAKAKARASEAPNTHVSSSKRKAYDSDAGDHGNSDPVNKLASLKFLPRALMVKKARKDDNANCGLAENGLAENSSKVE